MAKNLCIRCGKPRIVAKTWKEKVIISNGRVSVVEYTEMVCPDEECQKKVERRLLAQLKNRQRIEKDRQARNLAHQQNMVNLRLGKARNDLLLRKKEAVDC